MYTNQQASLVRQKFWTAFGQYMSPVPTASGEKANWINYKTGIKGISFKTNVDNNEASISIEITTAELREIFQSLKKQFQKIAGKDWDWHEASVSKKLIQINIFREGDWPQIISFLKVNLTALDEFWVVFKPVFEMQA